MILVIRKDQDVIQVNDNMSSIDEIFEDVIHESLERCRWIGEAEEHDRCVKTGVVAWLLTGTFTRICCIRTGIGSDTYHCDYWIRCLASSPTR